jgi:hypothetical protein
MRIIILDAIIPSEKDQDDIDNIHLNQPSTSTVYSPNVELLYVKAALHQGNNWQHVACNIF